MLLVVALGLFFHVQSLATSGDLDLSFGNNGKVLTSIATGDEFVSESALQTDGKVVVVGTSFGENAMGIARYTTDGSLDPDFNGSGKALIMFNSSATTGSGVAIQSDGKIVAVGAHLNASGAWEMLVIRLLGNGSLDTVFNGTGMCSLADTDLHGEAYSVAIQTDGKILVAGYSVDGSQRIAVARLLSNGTLDPSFNGSGTTSTIIGSSSWASSIRAGLGSKIIVGGTSTTGSKNDFALVQYLEDGTLDASFNGTGIVKGSVGSFNDYCSKIALQADGKIISVGYSAVGAGSYPFNVAVTRHLPNGSLDMSFNQSGKVCTDVGPASSFGLGCVVQTNGRIAVGGVAAQIPTGADFFIVTYNRDGSLDTNFGSNGVARTAFTANSSGGGLVVNSDGKLVFASTSFENGHGDFALVQFFSDTAIPHPGDLAFESDNILVNEEVGTFNAPIVRSGGVEGAVSVRVSSTQGTATSADYGVVNNMLVNFADGETTKTVPVSIISDPALNEPNQSFELTLSDPQNGATIVSPSKTKVWIIDAIDTTKPTISMMAPGVNANLNEGAIVNVTGSATDNKGVKEVQFSFNGAAFTDTIIALNATGTSATYTAPLAIVPGPNKVAVKSIDTRGNESVVMMRTFNYNVIRPLAVSKVGTGTLPKPFPGTDSTKKVGFSYSLQASPGAGQIFKNWTMSSTPGTGLTAAMLELPKITFTHQEGLVLTAEFIPNPFTADVIGKFNGLVLPSISVPSGGTLVGNDTVGLLSAGITGTGALTGTLKIDGDSLPLVAQLDYAGVARFGTGRALSVLLARSGKAPLEVQMALDKSSRKSLDGSVKRYSRGTLLAQSDFNTDRAAYSTAAKVDPLLATTVVKPYTVAFKHQATQHGLTTAEYPQGDGYATVTIKNEGTVTLSGKLADHTALSQTVPLSQWNTWPLFNALYASSKGSFSALMTLATTTDTDLVGSAVHWFRPYQNVQWYLWGWPEGIDVEVVGARYTPPALPGLLPVDTLNGNAMLTFADGLLSGSVTKNVNIHPTTSAATRAPTTDTSYTFTLVPANGLISGNFTHTNSTKPSWQGALLQKGANKGGYGYFMSVSPKIIDGTGESGSVELKSK